jgi:hypothetical protein
MDANNVPDTQYFKGYVADLVLAPLYHVPFTHGELVVGPQMGVFRSAFREDHEETAHGLAYGLNVGVLGTVGDMALGALLGYTRRHTTGTEVKPESSPMWSVPNALSATVAAIF